MHCQHIQDLCAKILGWFSVTFKAPWRLIRYPTMAEGMEVDTTPVVRDKKRFEVKKVCLSYVMNIFIDTLFCAVECCGTMGMG